MRPLTGPIICARCKQERDRSEFGIRKSTGTLLSWCRECYRQHNKEYRRNKASSVSRTDKHHMKVREVNGRSPLV